MPSKAAGPGGAAPGARPTFDLSIPIRRPAEVVFALLADVQDAEPIPRSATIRMRKEPLGPTAPGTRWHEAVRLAPGLWLHVESVVTEVQPPVRLAMDFSSLGFTGHLAYDLEPTTSGCVLHQRETLRPRLLLRWLGPVVLVPHLRRHLVERLHSLRDLIEAR